jgi:hypothetical protein
MLATHMYTCTYACACLYYMYYMYVCVYIYIYICIHTYIHILSKERLNIICPRVRGGAPTESKDAHTWAPVQHAANYAHLHKVCQDYHTFW